MIIADLLIPRKYTRIGHVSSLFILGLAISCFQHNEIYMGFFASSLYITTNLHWNYVRRKGLIRDLDIIAVKSCFFFSMFAAYKYYYCKRYYLISIINLIGYFCNERLNYHTIHNPYYLRSTSSEKKHWTYIRACLTHVFFLHISQCINGICLMVYSKNT